MKNFSLTLLSLISTMALADGKKMPNGAECADKWTCTPPKEKKKVIPVCAIDPKEERLKKDRENKIKELEAKVVVLEQENLEIKNRFYASQDENVRILKYKENKGNNSVSLLGGASSTKLETSSTPTNLNANTAYQFDLGLMYQHDFNALRASLEATINGTVLLGAGIRF